MPPTHKSKNKSVDELAEEYKTNCERYSHFCCCPSDKREGFKAGYEYAMESEKVLGLVRALERYERSWIEQGALHVDGKWIHDIELSGTELDNPGDIACDALEAFHAVSKKK